MNYKHITKNMWIDAAEHPPVMLDAATWLGNRHSGVVLAVWADHAAGEPQFSLLPSVLVEMESPKSWRPGEPEPPDANHYAWYVVTDFGGGMEDNGADSPAYWMPFPDLPDDFSLSRLRKLVAKGVDQ